MKKIVTAAQMKQLDRNTVEQHKIDAMILMERAALSVVRHLKKFDLKKVLVVCGSGNNGGDGIAVARLLYHMGKDVSIYFAGDPNKKSSGFIQQMEIAQTYPISWINNPDYSEYTTIVDALFGIGLSRRITGHHVDVIKHINQAKGSVVAVDIPSGINADDGTIMGYAICADCTVTFAYAKVGQLIGKGKEYCGSLYIEDIGIYEENNRAFAYMIEEFDLQKIPIRRTDGNKGTFGKVLLIAGTADMPGASLLCGRTIMRMGAGMLKVVAPKENREILLSAMPEAMLASYENAENAVDVISKNLMWADVVVIGPGIGRNTTAEAMVKYVLEQSKLPMVIDADGLNVISDHIEWLEQHHGPCILTPHMGEMSRLLKTGIEQIKGHRFSILRSFSERYQVQCVLKDAVTCVACPEQAFFLNSNGNCGMATAGAGDVLTGIIGGLLAIGTDWKLAGALGVWIHGNVGDRFIQKKGMAYLMASDLVDELADLRIGERRSECG